MTLTLLFFGTVSLACSFDTDCEVGSRCLKQRGQIDGFCVGGMFPGNSNDKSPVRDLMDLNGTAGNTCSFNVDCGPGSSCVKSMGQIDGVCLRKR